MKVTKFFLVVFFAFISFQLSAQDIILKKNNEMIQCKIKEIGLDEIKYILPTHPADLLFSIDKDEIDKVVLENGMEMVFTKALTNPESYKDNRKNAIKIDFMSPLTGNTRRRPWRPASGACCHRPGAKSCKAPKPTWT